jgi:hypothetical protein
MISRAAAHGTDGAAIALAAVESHYWRRHMSFDLESMMKAKQAMTRCAA